MEDNEQMQMNFEANVLKMDMETKHIGRSSYINV